MNKAINKAVFVKYFHYLLPLIIGIVVSFKITSAINPSFGGDSQEHIYKIQVLSEQMRETSPFLWGRWDWNSYCGNLFLTSYNPLTYFLLAALRLVSALSVDFLIRIWIFSVLPLATLAAYLLAYELSKDKVASLVGSTVFAVLSWLTVAITAAGTLSHLLTFIFVPLTMLFIQRFFKSGAIRSFVLATIFLCLTLITHLRVSIVFVTAIFFFVLAKSYADRSSTFLKALLIIPLSALIGSIFVVPSFYYVMVSGGAFIRLTSILSTNEVFLRHLSYLIYNDVGPVPLIFQIMAVLIYWKYGRKRNKQYFPYIFVFLLFIVWFFPSRLIVNLMSSRGIQLDMIQLDITTSSLFTTPVLSAYLMKAIDKNYLSLTFQIKKRFKLKTRTKEIVLIVVLIALLATPLVIWVPAKYDTVADATNFVNSMAERQMSLNFFDGFSTNLSDWVAINRSDSAKGQWGIYDGECAGQAPQGEAYLVSKNDFENFTYEADFKWMSGDLFLGVVFRFLDENNTYLLRWKSEWEVLELDQYVNGVINRVSRGFVYTIKEGTWHTLRVEALEDTFSIYIDNEKAYDAIDNKFEKGRIGFSILNGEAHFDNVRVYTLIKRNDRAWFRIWLWDRGPAQDMVSYFAGEPTVDGYTDTSANKEVIYFLNRTFISEVITDPAQGLRSLRIFNLRYILLSRRPEILQPLYNLSQVFNSLLDSNATKLVYSDSNAYVFELNEYYPIMASTNVFVIEKNEVASFYEIAGNEAFKPYSGIFLSRENDLAETSWSVWNGEFNNDGFVNVTVQDAKTEGMKMSLNVTVDRDSYVSIPISYFSGLRTSVDGRQVRSFKALPAFISLHLEKGTHVLTISRVLTPLETASIMVSVLTFSSLMVLVTINSIRKSARAKG